MDTSPIFLNATRWGVLYGAPGVPWGPDKVLPTVNRFALELGGDVYPLLPANGTSTDLDYIPAGARQRCLGSRALFDKPVGSSTGVADANGKTRLEAFRCALSACWPTLPSTWFSVIDSNGAHHLSLLLAERALTVGPNIARIIVNFDAHNDVGPFIDPTTLRCDNWGLFAIRAVGNIYPTPIADAYVSIGNKSAGGRPPDPPWSNTVCRFRPPAPLGPVAVQGANLGAQAGAILTLLENHSGVLNGGPWSGYAFYITVDRDVEQSSFTDYGDGAYPIEAVWSAVEDFVNALTGTTASFRGFDLCGLPTFAGGSVVSSGWPPEKRLQQAVTDAARFREIVEGA